MSIIDRAFGVLDDFQFRLIKRRAAFQPRTNRVISYRNPENSQEKRAIPAFGSDPSGFGEDWANYRLPKTRPFGPVPLESHENVHGHVRENSERPVPEQEPYQDLSLSPRAARSSETTDQKAIVGNRDGNIEWDGIVRTEAKKSFLSSSPKGGPTPGDIAEKDLKSYPYDFSS